MLRPVSDDDALPLARMFQEVFRRRWTAEQWRWKLQSRPSPVASVYVAEIESELAGQYAGIPMTYRTPGGSVTAMLSVDTMTATRFRRRGLLTALGRHTFEQWKAAGVAFVIGIPNANWGSRTVALGWRPLIRLRNIIRPLGPLRLALRRHAHLGVVARSALRPDRFLAGLLSAWPIAPRDVVVTSFDASSAEMDDLADEVVSMNRISVHRNADWIAWRFSQASGRSYQKLLARRNGRLTGWAALRLPKAAGDDIASIMEVVCRPGDQGTFMALVHRCVKDAVDAGATKLQVLVPEGSSDRSVYRRAGFIFARESLDVQIVPLCDPPPSWMLDGALWSLQPSDFDLS